MVEGLLTLMGEGLLTESHGQEMGDHLDASRAPCYNSHKAGSPVRYKAPLASAPSWADGGRESVPSAGWERAEMNANTPVGQPKSGSKRSGAVLRRMLQVVLSYLVQAAILFTTSGSLDWIWAWAYLGLGFGILVINAIILPAELIAERGKPGENVKGWDRLLTTLTGLPTLAVPIVAGLDERFGWSSQLAPVIHLAGLAFYALGQGLFSWAMASNRYFSTAVRIQMDRGHTVATGGPYRYVRHPGYAGFAVSFLGTPLALGSLWALIPAGLTACLLVVRTALEDRTLQEELPSYSDYARRVRYRLLPGIW